jgi:hypothetical protein
MSIESKEVDQDDIVYIDLTQYDGPLPPPPDYGLTSKQYEKIKNIRKSRPLRGLWVWALPLLAFVLPNDVCSVFKPLGWFMNLLGYVFPVLHVVRDTYSNGQVAQVVFGLTLLFAAVYMPCNMKTIIYRGRVSLNMSRYSLFMFQHRNERGYGVFKSPKSWRQLIVFFVPLAVILFVWMVFCDVIGYVAIYFLHDSLISVANWSLPFGGIVSGSGWMHGFIYSYVSSNRPAGFGMSRFGLLIQAYLLLISLVAEFAFPLIVYQFHSIGGILRWKKQMLREEEYVIARIIRDGKKKA